MHRLCLIIGRDDPGSDAMHRDFPSLGVKAYRAHSCEAALSLLRQWHFDAIVLDADGLGGERLNVLRKLQLRTRAPVMMVTSPREEQEQIEALASGATEVVHKPASTRLLAAKLLRLIDMSVAAPPEASGEVCVGPLVMNPRLGRAMVGEVPLDLTTFQFELLLMLASRAGEFVHRQAISRALRGPLKEVGRSADVHIYRIRKKLRDHGIESLRLDTVYGRGYCLSVADDGPGMSEAPVRYADWHA